MKTRARLRTWFRPPLWLGFSCALITGCGLFPSNEPLKPTTFKLPPLTAPKEAVQLEILFVDRPYNDPLMGDALWRELDQIADMPPDQRTRLRSKGWRIGHASSRPPRALEQLLERTANQVEVNDRERGLMARRVGFLSGTELPIEVTDVIPRLEVGMDKNDVPQVFENGRAVLRVRVERQPDGWARISFQPEIHHGKETIRPIATQFDWMMRQQSEVVPLYDQQFSLSLNTGEVAVISAADNDSIGPGRVFFRSLEQSGQMQRLMVVRVAEMAPLKPLYE